MKTRFLKTQLAFSKIAVRFLESSIFSNETFFIFLFKKAPLTFEIKLLGETDSKSEVEPYKVYWIFQFLSMKLEAVNTRVSPGIEVFPSKDVSPLLNTFIFECYFLFYCF